MSYERSMNGGLIGEHLGLGKSVTRLVVKLTELVQPQGDVEGRSILVARPDDTIEKISPQVLVVAERIRALTRMGNGVDPSSPPKPYKPRPSKLFEESTSHF